MSRTAAKQASTSSPRRLRRHSRLKSRDRRASSGYQSCRSDGSQAGKLPEDPIEQKMQHSNRRRGHGATPTDAEPPARPSRFSSQGFLVQGAEWPQGMLPVRRKGGKPEIPREAQQPDAPAVAPSHEVRWHSFLATVQHGGNRQRSRRPRVALSGPSTLDRGVYHGGRTVARCETLSRNALITAGGVWKPVHWLSSTSTYYIYSGVLARNTS